MPALSTKEILRMGLSAIKNTEDKSENAMIYDVVSAQALMVGNEDIKLESYIKKFDVNNLSGEELSRYVFQYTGLRRVEETPAQAMLSINADPYTFVKKDTEVTNGEDVFTTIKDVTADENGQAEVVAVAVEPGNHGNFPRDTINRLVSQVDGVHHVTNPQNVYSGTERESDDALRFRFWIAMQNPPRSGNPAHYAYWARVYGRVGYVYPQRAYRGAQSMRVVIADIRGLPADDLLVEQTDEYIRSEMPFGVEDLLVESAAPYAVNVNIKVHLQGGYNLPAVRDLTESVLRRYFTHQDINPYDKLNKIDHYAMACIVGAVPGIRGITDLTANGTKEAIMLKPDQIATLGELTMELV